MISFLRQRFLTVRYNYTNPVDRQRANALLLINWLTFMMWFVATLIFTAGLFTVDGSSGLDAEVAFSFLPLPFIFLTIYAALQRGYLRGASWLFVIFLLIAISVPTLTRLDTAIVILVMLPLSTAGLLLGRRGTTITLLLILSVVLIGAVSQSQLSPNDVRPPAATLPRDLFVTLVTIFFTGGLLLAFGGNTQQIVRQSVDELGRLQRAGRFASRVNQQNAREIHRALLRLLLNDLKYDFAQIFLTDGQGTIRQRVRVGLTNEQGTIVNDISIEASSALNDVLRQKQMVLVSQQDRETRRKHLQYTMLFGMCVPVIVEDRVIAIIDVQKSRTAFSRFDNAILNVLADQVAVLMRDAEAITTLRDALAEQEMTTNTLRIQLNEMRQQERQVMSSAWDVYLQQRGGDAIGFDLDAGLDLPLPSRGLPEDLLPAMQTNRVIVRDQDNERLLLVPISLNGRVLGAMSFSLPLDAPVTRRQRELAEKVAGRLAIALENKRLFEQSQSQANRERKANEIANLLIAATDVDSVLELAAGEFNNALGAIRTRIHIQPDALFQQKRDTRPTLFPDEDTNDGGELTG